jgi:hypothetical protein
VESRWTASRAALAAVVAGGQLADGRTGIDHGGPQSEGPGWTPRAFWTIAVIDGCYEGVSPITASVSRKRGDAGRGDRGDGTVVLLPAMRQADVHL